MFLVIFAASINVINAPDIINSFVGQGGLGISDGLRAFGMMRSGLGISSRAGKFGLKALGITSSNKSKSNAPSENEEPDESSNPSVNYGFMHNIKSG
jgi:hypothetical protein